MGQKVSKDLCLDTGLPDMLERMLGDPTISVVVIDSLFTALTTYDKANDQNIMAVCLTVSHQLVSGEGCHVHIYAHSLMFSLYLLYLQRLVEIAEKAGVTVILVHHTNKSSQLKDITPNAAMLSGSGAITNVPKNVLLAYPMKGPRATTGHPDWRVVRNLVIQ